VSLDRDRAPGRQPDANGERCGNTSESNDLAHKCLSNAWTCRSSRPESREGGDKGATQGRGRANCIEMGQADGRNGAFGVKTTS
jgi:hypothetical protein